MGIAATGAYSDASKAYAAKVNPNAIGRDMLSSQMARVKSDVTAQRRDHMGAMTALGAVTAGVVDGLDEVAEIAGGAVEVMSKATNRTAKTAGGVGLQLGLEMK